MIRLLLKTYNNYKKYLCKRESDDYMNYRGSGNNITDDLIVIDTEVLLETEDKKLFKEVGIYYSNLWNIVDNPLFLNKTREEGQGGNIGSNGYKSQQEKKNIKKNRPIVIKIKKYQKKFKHREGIRIAKIGENWSLWDDHKLCNTLNYLENKFGKFDEIDWDYKYRGRSKSNGEAIGKAVKGKTKNMVTVINKNGLCTKIPKDQYYSQKGDKENWEWVSNKSKESISRRVRK